MVAIRNAVSGRKRQHRFVHLVRSAKLNELVLVNFERDVQEHTSINPHLLDNRSTSSSVCKAGALVSPSSCLDGEPHGWVPVDTHSTPVPSSTGEAVGGLSNFTSPIHYRNMRNPYMVAEQEFRTTTPEPASQRPRRRDSQPHSRLPPERTSSDDDESSTPSMEQSEEAAPATTVSNNNKALKRCWRTSRWSHPSVRRTQQPSRRATRLVPKTHW